MTRETKMLAGLLGASGVLHFVITKAYASIVPQPLPYKTELVYASGVMEIGCAAMLTQPRTRRLAGMLSGEVGIRAGEQGLRLNRLAVGEHLMLGGDNMDLALGRHIEIKLFGQPGKLAVAALDRERRMSDRQVVDDAEHEALPPDVGVHGL